MSDFFTRWAVIFAGMIFFIAIILVGIGILVLAFKFFGGYGLFLASIAFLSGLVALCTDGH